MAFTVISDIADMIEANQHNVYTLYEADPDINVLARLTQWRAGLFPLLDKNIPNENQSHQWIAPTLALEAELSSDVTWWQAQEIVRLLDSQCVSMRFDGYNIDTENTTTAAAIVALYNTIWAAV